MKFKIKEPKQKTETFLIEPRYCGDCMLGYWLEKVPWVAGDPVCPVHRKYMWLTKEYALNNREKKVGDF